MNVRHHSPGPNDSEDPRPAEVAELLPPPSLSFPLALEDVTHGGHVDSDADEVRLDEVALALFAGEGERVRELKEGSLEREGEGPRPELVEPPLLEPLLFTPLLVRLLLRLLLLEPLLQFWSWSWGVGGGRTAADAEVAGMVRLLERLGLLLVRELPEAEETAPRLGSEL